MIRYIIKYGRWGAYFYDTLESLDLELYEVMNLLNQYDESLKTKGHD